MTSEVIVAILALAGTLIGSLAGILTANKLVVYRLEKLEQKVDKHNSVIERVTLLERDNSGQWKRLDEMKQDLEEIKHIVYGGAGK